MMNPNEDTCVLCGTTIPAPPHLPEYDPAQAYAHRCLCADCAREYKRPSPGQPIDPHLG
ncbi:hypothetical protein K9N68_39340 (plasmid) [Kovacikia minuta CCNUW1]|uniref:hypothetical protein n=1 Tax=Kovacikia minuta TaxID=2931930 RepID=UPI001CCE3548|nr:hypothetical protein [Kovacikia minuta]UBF30076.1 hypothetical protein K9N68_38475 [Kovacikia minuta CCNUW1]UBF30193.1 hypothetical protein K9N68_39340 [Kovacikia minuta CCNUW1]